MTGYSSRFRRLDQLLTKNRVFWQFMPFAATDLVWQHSHPGLCDWLNGLSDEAVADHREDGEALARALSPWLPDAPELHRLSQLEALQPSGDAPEPDWPQGLDVGIPGRKWQQITAFHRAIPALNQPMLEWCAGKGHLGRVLAASHQVPVVSLEWQQTLCEAGDAAAQRLQLPIRFVHADALDPASAGHVRRQQHAVALHACGDLHVALLQRVTERRGQAVTISPCCYHLIRDSHYQPLSRVGRQSQLTLSKHDLRLPLQETVTAGQRVRRQRRTEVSFRLGFDSLQRFARGCDSYLPVPNVQKAQLNTGFADFCRWAAEKKQLELPAVTDFEYWLQRGEQRFARVERMELVRQVFRRPLELWLIEDRVGYLAEAGYQVSVGTFCDKPITPRNILIHAERKEN